MTNHLKEAKEAYQMTVEIPGRATSNIRTFQTMFDEAKREITQDRTLSPEGQKIKTEQLVEKMGKELMEMAKKEKEEYQKAVVKASNAAKRALAEPLPKPHDLELNLHEQQVRKFEMDSIFTSPRDTIQKLNQYAETINDPYLADHLISKLPSIYDRLSANSLSSDERSKLRSVYSHLQDKTMTPERREAQNIVTNTESIFSKKLYQELHTNAIQSRLGPSYARSINDPSLFS